MVDFAEYQEMTKKTERGSVKADEKLLASALGLCGEAGSVAAILKKKVRDGLEPTDYLDAMSTELGDALWYISSIATSCKLQLAEIVAQNLERTENYYGVVEDLAKACQSLGFLDDAAPPEQQFPRGFEVMFSPGTRGGRDASRMEWRVSPSDAWQPLGDSLSDNHYVDDGYRFHDALHLAFVAILTWSPTIRSLMKRKRRYDRHVDECEDGGRGIVIDEGVVAWLYSRSLDRNSFATPGSVDTESLSVVSKMVQPVEVGEQPLWAWRHAISRGFVVWEQLRMAEGYGVVCCDLQQRTIEYRSTICDNAI